MNTLLDPNFLKQHVAFLDLRSNALMRIMKKGTYEVADRILALILNEMLNETNAKILWDSGFEECLSYFLTVDNTNPQQILEILNTEEVLQMLETMCPGYRSLWLEMLQTQDYEGFIKKVIEALSTITGPDGGKVVDQDKFKSLGLYTS